MLYWLTYHRPSYPSSSFLSSALSFLWRWLQHRMASCLSESRLRQIDRKDLQRLRRRCEAASPDLNVLEEGWSACEVLFRQKLCSFTSINMHRRTTNCEYGQKHTQGPSSLQTPQVLPCEAIQLQTTKYSAMPTFHRFRQEFKRAFWEFWPLESVQSNLLPWPLICGEFFALPWCLRTKCDQETALAASCLLARCAFLTPLTLGSPIPSRSVWMLYWLFCSDWLEQSYDTSRIIKTYQNDSKQFNALH